MKMTRHAATRSQQRCIPPLVIDLHMQFGATEKAPGGASTRYFDKRSRRQVEAYAGPLARLLSEHLDSYIVVTSDDQVITAALRVDRIHRH
ncbi:hypothetical protein [Nevskia ramosa]|uniref:hypothetical protein n=1 Tax=Nevskia ramosa TaxID=64002 RepID=UPI003D0FE20C